MGTLRCDELCCAVMGLRARALTVVLSLAAPACGDTIANPIREASGHTDGGFDAGRTQTGPDVPDTPYCAEADDWPVELAEAEYGLFRAIDELREEGVRCGDR